MAKRIKEQPTQEEWVLAKDTIRKQDKEISQLRKGIVGLTLTLGKALAKYNKIAFDPTKR